MLLIVRLLSYLVACLFVCIFVTRTVESLRAGQAGKGQLELSLCVFFRLPVFVLCCVVQMPVSVLESRCGGIRTTAPRAFVFGGGGNPGDYAGSTKIFPHFSIFMKEYSQRTLRRHMSTLFACDSCTFVRHCGQPNEALRLLLCTWLCQIPGT